MKTRWGASWVACGIAIALLNGCNDVKLEPVAGQSKPVAPALKSAGPPARAVIDARSYRFESMDQNQSDTHVFQIRNEGEGELQLRFAEMSCGCTQAKLGDVLWNRKETAQPPAEQVSVAPGGSVDLEMTWNTELRSGEFTTVAKLETNDESLPSVNFVVEGNIVAYVEVTNTQLRFDEARNGEETSTQLIVYSRKLDDLQITGFSSTNPLIEAAFEPAPESFLLSMEAKSGQTAKIKVLPGLPIGPYNATLTFETNCKERPTITVPMVGQVGGDVIITPAEKISFGTVKSSEGSSRGVLIKVRGEPADVSLNNVSLLRLPESSPVEPVFLNVTLKKSDAGNNFFQLKAEVPPGAPGGQFKGLIELDCDHPTAKLIKIPFSVQVTK